MVNAYFLDTSALVKRYIAEIGSNWVKGITNPTVSNDLTISQIAWVEVLSALSRRQREGSLSADDFNSVFQDFRIDFDSQYRVIEVDQSLIQSAGELVIQHPLRAYDSMQLASAMRVQSILSQMSNIQLIFLSADLRLLNIAQSQGLVTDNPNNYP